MTRTTATVCAVMLLLAVDAGAQPELKALSAVTGSQTDEGITLESSVLAAPGEMRNFVVADLDGDGLDDVIASYSVKDERKPAVEKRFALFLNSKEGFQPVPARTWAVPSHVAAYDVGKFRSGSKIPQLVYFSADGIELVEFHKGEPSAPVRVYEGPSWLLTTDQKNLTRLELLIDVNNDGVNELLLPLGRQTLLLRLAAMAEMAEVAATLALPLKAEIETWAEGVFMFKRIETTSGITTYRLPQIRLGELNGDGKSDIFALYDDRTLVFVQKPDGSFGEKPVEFDFELYTWDDIDRRSKPATIFRIEAADLNADGLTDIVVSRTDQTSLKNLDLLHRTRVYYNRNGKFAPGKPDFSVDLPFWIEMPLIVDVNGDGRLDIAFLFVKFNLWTIVKAIAASSISPQLWVYLQNPDGTFPAKRSDSGSVSKGYQLDRLDSGLGLKPVFADFNGDGWNDMLTNSGVDRYSVLASRSEKGKIFTSGDEAQFRKLKGSYDITLADFENDGRPDVAVRFESMPDHWNEILVLRNRTPRKDRN